MSNKQARVPFCKFLLEGKCKRGKDCKYRHHGPERPTATAYGCELWGPAEAAWPSINPHGPPGTFTTMIDDSFQATFSAGLLTTNVQPLSALKPKLRVDLVTSMLEVTFFMPSRNIWTHYGKKEDAEVVAKTLDKTVLRGLTFACSVKESTKGRLWTVQMTNMTDDFDEAFIRGLLPHTVSNPKAVVFGPLTYGALVSPFNVLEKKIGEFTMRHILGNDIKASKSRLRSVITLEFEGFPNLASLAASLNGQNVSGLGDCKIWASERLRVVLSIDRESYFYRSKQLKRVSTNVWRDLKVSVHIDDKDVGENPLYGSGKTVDVTLCGTSRTNIGLAKAAINEVCAKAVDFHLDYTRPVGGVQTHRLRLTKTKAYRDAVKTGGGFERAQRAVGSDLVSLDEESDPPAIIVKGDATVVSIVKKALSVNASATDGALTCPICLDLIKKAVVMYGCGHVCCKDCFAKYCATATIAQVPLRCFNTGCEVLMPVQLVRDNLDKEALYKVLSLAAVNQMQTRPKQYQQCAGPSCKAFFDIEAGGESLCPSCFTITCVGCKVEMHFGESCSDYKGRANGHLGALQKWMDENKCKRCTKCDAAVQKVDGCNNMRCSGCRSDFCWKCMKIFDGHKDVYGHLVSEHGGYFDPGEGWVVDDYVIVLHEEES
ncbi:E3 ubiquitin-protein ligase rnf14 [Recurvomyces mirabilis]|uniref:RBR-type E3 ubiquitin transferase n=1 Tax=Recurvomyces mirabilis TaxID=574656 RepID=A0AAE1C5T0_9PEZI|nr:E3 ubiquitin-protein ligase rnf14 [Recurvomyces mirabilis]KAK5158682.1 hypothetical protein LTS14_002790 [Recurvomyces mirabilis]